MTSTKKTTITVECERLYLWQSDVPHLFCASCNRDVRMLRIEEAAKACDLSLSAICQFIEDGHLHLREEGNSLFICADSLDEWRLALAHDSELDLGPR